LIEEVTKIDALSAEYLRACEAPQLHTSAMADQESEEHLSVIQAAIQRFRHGKPTAPHERQQSFQKKAFWWLHHHEHHDDNEPEIDARKSIDSDIMKIADAHHYDHIVINSGLQQFRSSLESKEDSILGASIQSGSPKPSPRVRSGSPKPSPRFASGRSAKPNDHQHVQERHKLTFNESLSQPKVALSLSGTITKSFEGLNVLDSPLHNDREMEDLDQYAQSLLSRCDNILQSYAPESAPVIASDASLDKGHPPLAVAMTDSISTSSSSSSSASSSPRLHEEMLAKTEIVHEKGNDSETLRDSPGEIEENKRDESLNSEPEGENLIQSDSSLSEFIRHLNDAKGKISVIGNIMTDTINELAQPISPSTVIESKETENVDDCERGTEDIDVSVSKESDPSIALTAESSSSKLPASPGATESKLEKLQRLRSAKDAKSVGIIAVDHGAPMAEDGSSGAEAANGGINARTDDHIGADIPYQGFDLASNVRNAVDSTSVIVSESMTTPTHTCTHHDMDTTSSQNLEVKAPATANTANTRESLESVFMFLSPGASVQSEIADVLASTERLHGAEDVTEARDAGDMVQSQAEEVLAQEAIAEMAANGKEENSPSTSNVQSPSESDSMQPQQPQRGYSLLGPQENESLQVSRENSADFYLSPFPVSRNPTPRTQRPVTPVIIEEGKDDKDEEDELERTCFDSSTLSSGDNKQGGRKGDLPAWLPQKEHAYNDSNFQLEEWMVGPFLDDPVIASLWKRYCDVQDQLSSSTEHEESIHKVL
jgi:hypothetical protein